MNADEPDRSLVFSRTKPGWFLVTHPTNDAVDIHVSGRQDPITLDVQLTEVLLHSPSGVTAADMRAVPLGRIAAHLARTHNAWWLAQGRTDQVIAELESGLGDEHPPYPRPLDLGRARVRRPDGTDPTAFLTSVAEAYRDLRTQTKNVAMAIAAEAEVPPATARRWIYDARRRGLLTEGGRGKG